MRFENDGGHFTVTSIMLEEISSCATAMRSYEVFLALAIMIFVGGIILAMYDANDSAFYFICGSVLSLSQVLLFLATRRTVLEFDSRGGKKITVGTGKMTPGEIMAIIDRVETAKEASRSAATLPTEGERRAAPRQPAPGSPLVPAAKTSSAEPAPEGSFWIARGGQEEGPVKLSVIKERLAAGTLAGQDYFLDPAVNDWVPLNRLPDLP